MFDAEMPGYSLAVTLAAPEGSVQVAITLDYPDGVPGVSGDLSPAESILLPEDTITSLPERCPADVPIAADAAISSITFEDNIMGTNIGDITTHYTSKQPLEALFDLYVVYLRELDHFSVYHNELGAKTESGISGWQEGWTVSVSFNPQGETTGVELKMTKPWAGDGL